MKKDEEVIRLVDDAREVGEIDGVESVTVFFVPLRPLGKYANDETTSFVTRGFDVAACRDQ